MKINWNQDNPSEALMIMSTSDFQEKYPDIFKKCLLARDDSMPKYCKVIMYQNVLSGTFVIPERKHPIKTKLCFSFALTNQNLYFFGEMKKVEKYLESFLNQYDFSYNTPLEFLVGFMNFMIREDVYFLEEYNQKLEVIEEDLFEGVSVDMDHYIMNTRKDMNILDSYYLQLNAMGETLQEVDIENKNTEINLTLNIYLSRISLLTNMVQTIKDYTSQIWNLRQTKLSDQQNQISTVLTTITTVFLPLTLITGWFGMNFVHLPWIRTEAGYHGVVIMCIVIVSLEIFYIYKKGWLNRKKR